jgi:hypothetical protein
VNVSVAFASFDGRDRNAMFFPPVARQSRRRALGVRLSKSTRE